MAGGGADADGLFETLMSAVPAINAERPCVVVIVTGPFLPRAEQRKLTRLARGLPVHVIRTVNDSLTYLSAADAGDRDGRLQHHGGDSHARQAGAAGAAIGTQRRAADEGEALRRSRVGQLAATCGPVAGHAGRGRALGLDHPADVGPPSPTSGVAMLQPSTS